MQTTSPVQTPLSHLWKWELERPERLFLQQPFGSAWRNWKWKDAAREIRSVSGYLRSLNLPARSNVAILSRNCAHWILADLAIWNAGHVSVPVYPTLTGHELQRVLEHSECRAIFLGKLDNFAAQKEAIPRPVLRFSFPDYGPGEGVAWSEMARAEEAPRHEPGADDLATIIYTSGTTGNPKGVMITFGAVAFVTSSALQELKFNPEGERFFSYLPLGHIAERMLIEMGCIYTGGSISFAESIQQFSHNLAETKPTVFLAVPRIWSKMQEKILEKVPQQRLNLLLRIPLLRALVRRKVREGLGLSHARWIFTGAAPIRASLLEWFDRLGIVIHEVYGMTENVSYSHANVLRVKYGTVGQKWANVEVRFSEEGEIQVRHDGMMKGYFKEPQLTAECFTDDGFMKTGDVGVLDDEGFLRITGRVKDYFKTDKGKYIAPSAIEMKLLKNSALEQACVVGTGLPQPIALVTLSGPGRSEEPGHLAARLEEQLRQLNRELQSFEQIEKIIVLKEDWSVDNGFLTPTLKVKRNVVEAKHREHYSSWFQQAGTIIFEQ